MPIIRLGAEMSALKAGIVDMVQRGGEDGVPIADIFSTLFRERNCTPDVLKTHVWQINEMIRDGGYKIVGVREHGRRVASYDRYRLTKIAVRSVA